MESQNRLAVFVSDNCSWVAGGVIDNPHYIVVSFFVAFDWVSTGLLRATNIVESTDRA